MEADHGQLKRRLRPMRGLKTDQSTRIIIAGHAFIQNIRRGHYELGVDEPVTVRVVAPSMSWLRRSDQPEEH
jgi:transposase-like protein